MVLPEAQGLCNMCQNSKEQHLTNQNQLLPTSSSKCKTMNCILLNMDKYEYGENVCVILGDENNIHGHW